VLVQHGVLNPCVEECGEVSGASVEGPSGRSGDHELPGVGAGVGLRKRFCAEIGTSQCSFLRLAEASGLAGDGAARIRDEEDLLGGGAMHGVVGGGDSHQGQAEQRNDGSKDASGQ
jgi:hypothetical protein